MAVALDGAFCGRGWPQHKPDMTVLNQHEPDVTVLMYGVRPSGTLVGFKRKRFVAVALDGAFRAPAVAPLLQRLIKARAEAKAGGVGLGVVSMLSFEGTVKALQARPH